MSDAQQRWRAATTIAEINRWGLLPGFSQPGENVSGYRQRAARHHAWQIHVIDPVWGRNDLFWKMVSRSLTH